MDRFSEARDRGAAYLLSTQLPDGSVPDAHLGAGQYWGTPIALQVAGHSNAAGRLLDWIRSYAFTSEGDFGPSPKRDQDVKGGVKVYQRGGAKLYQWTRQHDWERCRGLLKLGPSLSPDLNSSCCYA